MGYLEYRFSSEILECEACVCVTIPSLHNLWELYQPAGQGGSAALAEGSTFRNNLHRYSGVCMLSAENQAGGERLIDMLPAQSRELTLSQDFLLDYAQEKGCMTVSVDLFKSFGCNMYRGYRYFDFLTQEVMRMVQHTFPSSPRREDNFIVGFSMGAHVAMKAALTCPEKFAAVMSMSGAKDLIKMMRLARDILGSDGVHEYCDVGPLDEAYGGPNDLLHLASELAKSDRPRPKIFHSCGEDDYGLALCREFHEYLDSVGLVNTFITVPGVHDPYYTDNMLRRTFFEFFDIGKGGVQ